VTITHTDHVAHAVVVALADVAPEPTP